MIFKRIMLSLIITILIGSIHVFAQTPTVMTLALPDGFVSNEAQYVTSAADSAGNVYVGYLDNKVIGTMRRIKVLKVTDTVVTELTSALNGIDEEFQVYSLSLAVINGEVYVAYQHYDGVDFNQNGIKVWKYTNEAWVNMTENMSQYDCYGSLAIHHYNDLFPVLAFVTSNGVKTFYFDSSTTTWKDIVVTHYRNSNREYWYKAHSVDMASQGTSLYLAFTMSNNPPSKRNLEYYSQFYNQDLVRDRRITIMQYENGAWKTVGLPMFTGGCAKYISLETDTAGKPVIAHQDRYSSGRASVWQKVSVTGQPFGEYFTMIGKQGFTNKFVNYTGLAIGADDTKYVMYSDTPNWGRATIMRYVQGEWSELAIVSAGHVEWTTVESVGSGTSQALYACYADWSDLGRVKILKISNIQ